MKKKILIIFSGLLVVGLFVYIFIPHKRSPNPASQIPTLSIPDPIGGNFIVENKIESIDFNFPKSLPLLSRTTTSPFSLTEAKGIAKGFGFITEPSSSRDVKQGMTYFWNNNTETLFVYSKTRKILYGLLKAPTSINKGLSNESLISLAKDFLVTKSLVNKDEIDFSFFSYYRLPKGQLEGPRVSTKDEANIYVVNFSPSGTNYKVVTLDPQLSPISVWVAPDGTITQVVFIKMGSFVVGQEKYELKDYQVFDSSLKKSIVVSLDDGYISMVDLPKGDLQTVTINKVELAYLADPLLQGTFQPVFLLGGTARVREVKEEVPVLLYLPALKN